MRRLIGKIKYVNMYFASVCVTQAGYLDRGVCSVLFFLLSWFNVPAPPLRPSLLPLLTVHNLIKGLRLSIMIQMTVPLPDSPDSSLCARKPLTC